MKKATINEIKDQLHNGNFDEELLNVWRQDERKGVQRLLVQHDKRLAEEKLLEDNFTQIAQFDAAYRKQGYTRVAGVDEAGRGPLAGPVVAAAVILPEDFRLIGLTDSKKVSEANRNLYFDIIKQAVISYEIVIISNTEIDRVNIYEATKMAMYQSLTNLDVQPDFAIIDAVPLVGLPFPSAPIIKGDDKSLAIAAASILAKVTRDRLMNKMDEEYPEYDLANNKGYGTKKHLDAIEQFGITKYHRQTFSPVSQFVLKLR